MGEELQGGNASPYWNDKPLDIYANFSIYIQDDENEVLTDHVGRGFLDLPMQEAQSAIASGFVNGLTRAATDMQVQ